MTIEIRPVPRDQMRAWADALSLANSEELTDEVWRDCLPMLLPDAHRVRGAYDGDRLIGGGSTFTLRMSVPGGKLIGAAGITWVGIEPTHRRRGALRALMSQQLAEARAAGESVAILWASEGSIYQRFGYGLATLTSLINLERERAVLLDPPAPGGSVRFVTMDEAADIFPPIFEANLAVRPGFFTAAPEWWNAAVLADFKWARNGMDRKLYAIHETDGSPDAYVMYRVRHAWPQGVPASELHVQELMALNGVALREMWRFVFGVDLIKTIHTRAGDPHEPLLDMLLEPRRLNVRLRDGLWLRVVDVPAALGARAFGADGSLVIEVPDEFMPAAGGRWRLTTAGGRGTAQPTMDAAELVLTPNDLGAIYLGGTTLADLARAGRGRELVVGASERGHAMFGTDARPWCPQLF